MPQVSKNIMRREVAERTYQVFEKAVQKLTKPQDIRNFINDLLTPTEKIMLSKRLAIAILLEKGYDYRQISNVLKVSFATINAVIKQKVVLGGKGYKKVISEILKEEKSEEAFLEFQKWVAKLISHPTRHRSIESGYEKEKRRLSRREI